jgi:hypothetical protein
MQIPLKVGTAFARSLPHKHSFAAAWAVFALRGSAIDHDQDLDFEGRGSHRRS